MPKCPHCTNEAEAGLADCPHCGRALSTPRGAPLNTPPLDQDTLEQVRMMLADGHKLAAIKHVREHAGVSLAEAVALTHWLAGEPGATQPGNTVMVDPATVAEVRQLLSAGRRVEAVELLSERTQLGLATARMAVDTLSGEDVDVAGQRIVLGQSEWTEVREMLAAGQRIQAIKKVRDVTGLGLAEAKAVVDQLDPPAGGSGSRSGCFTAMVLLLPALFGLLRA